MVLGRLRKRARAGFLQNLKLPARKPNQPHRGEIPVEMKVLKWPEPQRGETKMVEEFFWKRIHQECAKGLCLGRIWKRARVGFLQNLKLPARKPNQPHRGEIPVAMKVVK